MVDIPLHTCYEFAVSENKKGSALLQLPFPTMMLLTSVHVISLFSHETRAYARSQSEVSYGYECS